MARIRPELGPLSLGRLAPAWERTIRLEIARTIAASSRGAGALIEQRSDVPVVQIWTSEVDVRRAVELSIQRLPARLSTPSLPTTAPWGRMGPEWSIEVGPARDPGPGPSELSAGSPERVRYRGDPERGRGPVDGSVDREPRPLEVPPSFRWAAQTHWISDGSGAVRAHHRFRLGSDPEAPGRTNLFQWALARHFASAGYPPVRARVQRANPVRRWHWDSGRLTGRSRTRTFRVRAEEAARGLVPCDQRWELDDPTGTHTVVLGASGTGKTSFLAQVGRREIASGRSVIAFDLHGDLAPRLTSGLGPEAQARVHGIDASEPVERIPGLAVIGSAPPGQEEREAAFLVAALRRLSSDGNELYWGFRLERIFDTFVRLTQETGGTLLDLYALLTEARRRQSARWSSRSSTSIGFLDELGPLLQRNPEFLWPAAARVAKVALVPAVAALLAPAEEGIPVRRLLSEGRSIIWRLPFGVLGPETSAFVASLIAGRIYLDRTGMPSSELGPVLFLIDEAQAFAPRVLAEILSEGRKFGLRALIATQYPERMAPDLRSAAQGTVSTHVVFRVPPAGAVSSGSWVGLDRAEAQQLLPQLPVGWAVVASSVRRSLTPMTIDDGGLVPSSEPWAGIVRRSVVGSNEAPAPAPALGGDPVVEALLLAIFGITEEGRPADRASIVSRLSGTAGLRSDPEGASGLLSTLQRRGWAEEAEGVWTVTRAGLELLGFSAHTGATSESVEHRQLLLEAFRIFARKGCHLRILRQGRFDRRTPDALLPQLPSEWRSRSAREAVQLLDHVKGGWAWRFFGGRDVFVEAEVTGARRSDRIRHGLDKADHEGAFPLFLVSDAKRAQFVRRVLRGADRLTGPGPGLDAAARVFCSEGCRVAAGSGSSFDRMVRAFIAVDLPVDVRSTSGRPTHAPTHLTLRFLGEVRPEEMPEIGRALGRAVEGRPAFLVHLRGVGAFPNARVPKVVWIGIEEGARELTEIANRISDELELLGRPREPRPFVPHLTLMRVRDRRSSEEAYRWLTAEAERDFGTLPVREVFLKESLLTREGPIHTVIQTSPLTGDLGPPPGATPGPTPNDQPPSA